MTEAEFRQKYPHSTDEQVRLYAEAVAAEATSPPVAEPDLPMPLITVPEPMPLPTLPEPPPITTYDDLRRAPYRGEHRTGGALGDILLGFNADLSPEQRQHLQNADMSEEEMLAMIFDPQMFSQQHFH